MPSPKVLLDALVENITVEGYGRRARDRQKGAKGARRAYLRSTDPLRKRRAPPGVRCRTWQPRADQRPLAAGSGREVSPAYAYRCDERAGGARALRTDRGERLAVRRSPTRFRCGFFGPLQLHARRSGRCACGGVVPITLAVARNCARAKLERQRHRSTPGAAKCDFSPSDAE